MPRRPRVLVNGGIYHVSWMDIVSCWLSRDARRGIAEEMFGHQVDAVEVELRPR
jgi:hypothetical protein